jgi:mannosyltransferase OCH1-like enzyme
MLVWLIIFVLMLMFINRPPVTSDTVWTYWHSPLQPKVIRKCIDNWEHVGKCKDIRVLNDVSVYRWIPFFEMIKINSITSHKANKSDLIRLYLIKTYGGTWMDASIILTQKLHTWLPEERVFCYKADRFSKENITCLENFFIKAPPNHPFINEWYEMCKGDFEDKNYKENNETYRNIIGKNGDYLVPYVSSMKIDLSKYNDIVLESSEKGPYRDTIEHGWDNPEKICKNISYSYRVVKLWNKLRNYINPDDIPMIEKTTKIPKVLFQTYGDKNKIPKKVHNNINEFAKDYKYELFDDNDCYDFILTNYDKKTADKFKTLKTPAHKADLFRYCYIYKNGGIYMDIKTELIKPLDTVFTDNNNLYTVLSIQRGTIYNGIIASGPGRSIFLDLIKFMVDGPDVPHYLSNCAEFYNLLLESYDTSLQPGINENNLYLFDEVCVTDTNKIRHGLKDTSIEYEYVNICHDGLDRYNKCCHIYDKGKAILKSRYSDFPWK